MSHSNHTPPLLLTKRLTAFLHANQTPTLPTLLLTTPHGKLLAHASKQPVSALRTYATVAASLLTIHSTSSLSLPSALPGSRTPDLIGSSPPDEDRNDADSVDDDQLSQSQHQYDSKPKPVKPATITVQLTGGTVVIRRLKCGLLFVCAAVSLLSGGRGKGKKSTVVTSHEDPGSGGEETLPAYKRRGRPQKPLKEEIDEEEAEKIEEEDGENTKTTVSSKEVKSPAAAENGKKRKRYSQVKENPESVKEENGVVTRSSTNDSVKSNGFRQNGSRRKSKPRRAAEVGVECK